MEHKNKVQHPVYSNNVIEFVTVAAEYCAFLEKCGSIDTRAFLEKMTKIAPLLYLKVSMLPNFDECSDFEIRQFVTEDEYEFIHEQVSSAIGQFDEYLEVFHPDMQYSDTPVIAYISEDLTDIYQDLKDMIANFQSAELEIMNDALLNCSTNFKEYWGQKLLNATKAMHNVLYTADLDADNNNSLQKQEDLDD